MKKIIAAIVLAFSSSASAQCWKQIEVGNGSTIALKKDSTLWAWGYGGSGALGIGKDTGYITRPFQIGKGMGWASISHKGSHVLAIRADGTLWAWGYNYYGQVGDSTIGAVKAPKQIGKDKDWKQVSAGGYHSTAIKTDGTLWAWGSNSRGSVGIDSTSFYQPYPVQVGSDKDWVFVAAGGNHSNHAVKADGSLWGWGYNYANVLGDGTDSMRLHPVRIGSSKDWMQISHGALHVLAIKKDSTLWVWGESPQGALGLGKSFQPTPAQLGNSRWASVSASYMHSIAIQSDRSLWGWGYNVFGQMGQGNTPNQYNTPVMMGNKKDWVTAVAGYLHVSLMINSSGELWGCGYNGSGEIGDGSMKERDNQVLVSCSPLSGLANAAYSNTAVTVYPVPAHQVLHIAIKEDFAIDEITIMDAAGKQCGLYSGNNTQIDIAGLPSGMYVALIKHSGGMAQCRFVVE